MEEGVTIEQIIQRAIEDGLTLEIVYNYEFDASKPIFNLYGKEY